MRLTIVRYGNPVLRKKCVELTAEYPGLQDLIANMWETLDSTKGVGLAAPQVGIPVRLFLLKVKDQQDKEVRMTIINPEIIESSKTKMDFNEGCLSIPGVYSKVSRPDSVVVKYFTENFEPLEFTFDQMWAIVFQHEFDHINGVLFIDRISALSRKLLASKLKKIMG
jgi:peptide deformylase